MADLTAFTDTTLAPRDAGTDADAVAEHQRDIQKAQDQKDADKAGEATPSGKASGEQAKAQPPGVQAGARHQPDQLPAQHIDKPGLETELQLKPQFLAPDYKGSQKLSGMTALITGGDSGIGRAVAVLFAREGANVAIAYLNEHEDAQETARHVRNEGQRALLVPGDVKDKAYCKAAVEAVLEEFGQIDILVNNAAFQEHADSIEDLTEERFDETLRTNVYGYFHMTKAVVPHLKKGASIINTGSVVGLRGSAHLIDYSTTKGAIHAFTKSLASNLISKGIRVNAVAPGPVWTPLNPADAPADQVAEFGQQTDMKRAAQPEELSPAYVFLASPACAGYITGIVLPVTGSVGAV